MKYLDELKIFLENDDFENIDSTLQTIYSLGLEDDEIAKIDDILTEVTLYSEFKEQEYKQNALELFSQL